MFTHENFFFHQSSNIFSIFFKIFFRVFFSIFRWSLITREFVHRFQEMVVIFCLSIRFINFSQLEIERR